MIIAYFGADGSIENEDEFSIRRRNMAILYALGQTDKVDKIINCIRGSRITVWRNYKKKASSDKIIDYYFGPILPEKGFLGYFTHPLNLILLSILNRKVSGILKDKQTISWCYWPKGFKDWEFLKIKGPMVFDTDHNIIEDPNLPESAKKERKELLCRAGLKSTFILSSSRSMLGWFEKQNCKNTRLVLNGVFLERMMLMELQKERKKMPVITYCGTLSKWMKIDWLFTLIEKHPDWQFNIIGSNYKTDYASQLGKYSNVKLHGFLEPSEVSKLLKETNVAIGLYQEERSLDVNSMKLYDYLATGVPTVVNAYHKHLEQDFNGLLKIANSFKEFEDKIECSLNERLDHEKLRSFLLNASWQNRVEPILMKLI